MAVEAMEIAYKQEGDYLIPDLTMPEEPEEILTKYGMLRQTFLKEHHSGVHTAYLLKGKLKEHCLLIQKQAEEMMDRLVEHMMKSEEVTEELKASNQMEWVRRMNSIRNRADEIVLSEIVYSL